MSWKITTFVLGAAVVVLLVREFTRPEPATPRPITSPPVQETELAVEIAETVEPPRPEEETTPAAPCSHPVPTTRESASGPRPTTSSAGRSLSGIRGTNQAKPGSLGSTG